MINKPFPTTHNREELITPLSPGLPLTAYVSTFGSDTYDCIDWHWHSEPQYCHVLSGQVCFRTADQSLTVSQGGGVIIRPKLAHMSTATGEKSASYFCVVPHMYFLSNFPQYLLQFDFSMLALQTHDESQNQILQDLKRIFRLFGERGFGYELRLYSELFLLWHNTLTLTTDSQTSPRDFGWQNERLIAIFSYLHHHYDHPIHCLISHLKSI
ncbi:cupin domain-containing protein [Feifania hominis]|uniref:Cupin domain-containing protein n=1 Tax=Feifania hominis TaxID=2763660 RepID=A0A926DE28_9FIRM|nr:cupin domain-containing protein [Feifania hominis]MBC8535619.1 cupin domain-containing protein [Feifania hominis]